MNTIIDDIGDAIRHFNETWEIVTNNGSSVSDELTSLEIEIFLESSFTKLSKLAVNNFSALRSALREETALVRTNVNIEAGIRWSYFNKHLKAVIYSPASELLNHINSWLERNNNLEEKVSDLIVKVPALELMYGPQLASKTTNKTVRSSKYLLDNLKKVIKQELEGSPKILNDPDSLRYVDVKSSNKTEHVKFPTNLGTTTIDKLTNKFNDMPLDEVRQWFIQLTEKNSRNGNPFLTTEWVEHFIDRAFCKVSFTEKLSINEKAGDKANIIGLFHLFYTYCITHQPGKGKLDPTATAEKYIRLLTDYFDNWTFAQVKNNFRNGGNWKRTS